MSIHLDRNDFLKGTTAPTNLSPEFVGQFYIDTNHKIIYQNIDGSTAGWKQISQEGHTHEAADFVWLHDVVEALVDENYVTEAVQAMRITNNHWTGVNNFSDIRKDGQAVLSSGDKLEDFSNVLVDPTNMTVGHVLGWTGSGWGLYAPDGTLPSGGGTDFSNFVTKTDIVDSVASTATNKPLSAAQGLFLKTYVDETFAKTSHDHGDIYASAQHTHSEYMSADGVNTVTGQLLFNDTNGVTNPISFSSDGGMLSFKSAATSSDQFKMEVDGAAGASADFYIGGSNGVAGKELTLNYETVRIPSGKILTDSTTGRIIFSPIRIQTATQQGTKYVSNVSSREYGLHLSNTSLVGVNQIAFTKPSIAPEEGILFPRSYAGNAQPSEIGMYNYLYILDDHIYTDATLATTKNYIELNGRRIFFSPIQPGRDSRPGDIWIKV